MMEFSTWIEVFRWHSYEWDIKNLCSELGVECKMQIENSIFRKRIEFVVTGDAERVSKFKKVYCDWLHEIKLAQESE